MTADVPSIPSALANHVGTRERVLNDYMYYLPPGAKWRATFRPQLFTALGLRPVAIATQMPGNGNGASLTNAAETCATRRMAAVLP